MGGGGQRDSKQILLFSPIVDKLYQTCIMLYIHLHKLCVAQTCSYQDSYHHSMHYNKFEMKSIQLVYTSTIIMQFKIKIKCNIYAIIIIVSY